MIRKLTFSALIAAGGLTGLAVTPNSASAYPTGVPGPSPAFASAVGPGWNDQGWNHRRVRYEVVVWHRTHWDVSGTFGHREDARRAAYRLRCQGLQVEVRRVVC